MLIIGDNQRNLIIYRNYGKETEIYMSLICLKSYFTHIAFHSMRYDFLENLYQLQELFTEGNLIFLTVYIFLSGVFHSFI